MEDWSLLRADGYPQGDPRGRYEFRPDRKRPVSCQHRGSPWTCAESLLRGVSRGREKRTEVAEVCRAEQWLDSTSNVKQATKGAGGKGKHWGERRHQVGWVSSARS